jgi:hypothetical protein
MDAERIIKEIKLRLNKYLEILDTDPEDSYYLDYIQSSADFLAATNVLTVEYSVDEDEISPETSAIDGLLIATYSTAMILDADLTGKVRSGQFGIRFRTGQDEISTVEVSKQMAAAAEALMRDFRDLVIAKVSGREDVAHRLQ